MLQRLKEVRDKIQALDEQAKLLSKEMEEIRSHYKYQMNETRSISESLIVNYVNMSDLEGLVEDLNELIEYETDYLGESDE